MLDKAEILVVPAFCPAALAMETRPQVRIHAAVIFA
jgi:hypothetical protein